MIELRTRGSGSWLDPDSARSLAAKLSTKLWERCHGHRGLFVTLTYDRTPYEDARELYDRAAEEQHVALFMRKLERRYGVKFGGKWFCKLEFQRGGWVHWHLIILDVGKLPQEEVADMWGHGFIKLRRLSKKNVKYCTKYIAKLGDMPAWLLMAKPRSVKVIRVSKGFWGESRGRKEPSEETEGDKLYDRQCRSLSRVDAYVPIAARISRAKRRTIVRDERGLYSQIEANASSLVCELFTSGHAVIGKRDGWVVVDASMADVERAAERVVAATAAATAGRSFNLIRTSNPDVEDNGYTWWINAWYRQQLESGAA